MRVPEQRQQCLLGGDPELFQISQLDSLVFRFVISCSNVGFLVIRLSPIVLDSLKLGFFLCNDRGFQEAISFSKLDYGPSCDWIEVRSRSSKRSYADAVKSKVTPLSGLGSQFNPAGRFFLGYYDLLFGRPACEPKDFYFQAALWFSFYWSYCKPKAFFLQKDLWISFC